MRHWTEPSGSRLHFFRSSWTDPSGKTPIYFPSGGNVFPPYPEDISNQKFRTMSRRPWIRRKRCHFAIAGHGLIFQCFTSCYSFQYVSTFHPRAFCLKVGYLAGYRCDVAYLHDSAQMAHRDIKPSNILIYEDLVAGGDLVLKLTDFGLSIDLTNALTWEHGSLALQSAWRYDSPESRRQAQKRSASHQPGTF